MTRKSLRWMRGATILAAATLGVVVLGACHASASTLEKIRSQGFLSCGGVSRPGLAKTDGQGQWSGLEVDICRAIATAALGPNARFRYHGYENDKDFDAVREGRDDLAFLTFSEMLGQSLTDKLLPGPNVFVETHDFLVAVDSPVRTALDLAGSSACFIIAKAPEDNLDAWLDEHKIELTRFAFREDGEMFDAYSVQRCKSVVGESTTLAQARLDGGINHLKSRLLPDHLAAFPIVATTPLTDDAQWAAIVAWTVHTLVAADQHETIYRPDGLRAMAVSDNGLGLDKGWQRRVVASVGSYATIFERTVGTKSLLKLDPGLNAPAGTGGMLVFPHLD